MTQKEKISGLEKRIAEIQGAISDAAWRLEIGKIKSEKYLAILNNVADELHELKHELAVNRARETLAANHKRHEA